MPNISLSCRALWRRYLLGLVAMVAWALVSVLVVSVPAASGDTFGALTITTDTDFTDVHYGTIIIGADDVTLDCGDYFVVGSGEPVGILVDGWTGVTIQNCSLSGFTTAIRINDSASTRLVGNLALDNAGAGFYVTLSASTVFVENTATSNSGAGFDVRQSSGGVFTDNVAVNNVSGFSISQSSNMTLRGNQASGSTLSSGFSLSAGSSSTLEDNIATNNNNGFRFGFPTREFVVRRNLATGNTNGFSLSSHSASVFTENTSAYNTFGFQLQRSDDNVFTGNTSMENRFGFYLDVNSDDNTITHNNIVDNETQATSSNSTTVWHDPVALEGNYWSDYSGLDNGSGAGKHAIAGDGIGDTRIPHPGPGFDSYPFVESFSNPLAAEAGDDSYDTDEDTALIVGTPGVLVNDDAGAIGSLEATVSSGPSNGQLVLNLDGSFTYTPAQDFCGTDEFRYRADNGFVASSDAAVDIEVDCFNDSPSTDNGGPYIVDEGQTVTLDGSGTFDVEDATVNLLFEWDLDYQPAAPDFTETGPSINFDATATDGPASFDVALRVTDSEGASDVATTTVTVRNVVPTVLLDDPGLLLPGSEFELSGSFSDISADTHVASINWGDGSASDLGSVAEPQLFETHTYEVTGTFEVEVFVTDDDGGTGSTTLTVEVVDPETAISDTADDLSTLAASESDAALNELIEEAATLLVGRGTDQSGALQKLNDGDVEAAMRKLLQAAQLLEDAIAGGATVEVEWALHDLTTVARIIAEDLLTEATEYVDSPSRGEQKQLDRIAALIEGGNNQAETGAYVDAISTYTDAVRRASALLG